jgi:hypothetical protein
VFGLKLLVNLLSLHTERDLEEQVYGGSVSIEVELAYCFRQV